MSRRKRQKCAPNKQIKSHSTESFFFCSYMRYKLRIRKHDALALSINFKYATIKTLNFYLISTLNAKMIQ